MLSPSLSLTYSQLGIPVFIFSNQSMYIYTIKSSVIRMSSMSNGQNKLFVFVCSFVFPRKVFQIKRSYCSYCVVVHLSYLSFPNTFQVFIREKAVYGKLVDHSCRIDETCLIMVSSLYCIILLCMIRQQFSDFLFM